MLNPPIISIVTPSLNQERYLRNAIESVISQDGDFFIDYLIMDGDSNDGSKKIIIEYEKLIRSKEICLKCNGIQYRWVSEPDRGQAHAINKGWQQAHGDIITWINSDDYYTEGAFAKATEVLAKNNSPMMIYGDLQIIDDKGYNVGHWKQQDFDYSSLLYRRMDISQPGSFLRRDVLSLIGNLDEDLHYVMDLDYWLRCGQVGVIEYVPFVFASYRVHESAKSSSFPKLWQAEMLRLFAKYFKGNKHIDRTERNRIIAETYRHTARLFLPSGNRRELFRSCLLATLRYPFLLFNSDLYGYWVYAVFGFGLGDRFKKQKRAAFRGSSIPYMIF